MPVHLGRHALLQPSTWVAYLVELSKTRGGGGKGQGCRHPDATVISTAARVRDPKVEWGVPYARERFFKGGDFKDLTTTPD